MPANGPRVREALAGLKKEPFDTPIVSKDSVRQYIRELKTTGEASGEQSLSLNDLMSLFKKATVSYAFGDTPGLQGLDASGIGKVERAQLTAGVKLTLKGKGQREIDTYIANSAKAYVDALVAASESNPAARAILSFLDVNVSILNAAYEDTQMDLNNVATCAQDLLVAMGFFPSGMSLEATGLATAALKPILLARQSQLEKQNTLGTVVLLQGDQLSRSSLTDSGNGSEDDIFCAKLPKITDEEKQRLQEQYGAQDKLPNGFTPQKKSFARKAFKGGDPRKKEAEPVVPPVPSRNTDEYKRLNPIAKRPK